VYVCVQKLQGFPNPDSVLQGTNTRANANAIGMHQDLSENVIDFPTALAFEANV
jgi:hypothetical protein